MMNILFALEFAYDKEQRKSYYYSGKDPFIKHPKGKTKSERPKKTWIDCAVWNINECRANTNKIDDRKL